MKMRVVETGTPVYCRLYCSRFAEIAWEAPGTSSGTMLHSGAHPMAVGDRTTTLSLGPISI
jgi:hypothetical protein